MTSTTVPRAALAWALVPSGTTEAQTFYVTTSSGIFVLIQLAYSSINSWSPSLQITARVYLPDGTKKLSNAGLGASSLKLTDQNLSASAGPLTIKLVSDGTDGAGAPSNGGTLPSFNVTFSATPGLVIDLNMQATVEAFQIGDGKRFFVPGTPSTGYISSRFAPKMKVTGKIVVDGTQTHDAAGHGVFTHAIQSPPQHVSRWNFANFQNESDALLLYQYEMPKGKYAQDLVSQGALVLDGQLVAVLEDNHSELDGLKIDDFSGYKVPSGVKHVWQGKTSAEKGGETVRVTLRLGLGRLLDKIDVLSELPFLVRKFIQTFITAPYVYQWGEDAEAVVEIGGQEKRRIRGRAFHENTFLSELSQ